MLHALQSEHGDARLAAIEADLMPALTALKLDQTQTTFVGRKGDIVCFLTSVAMDVRKREPALLLTNRANPREKQVCVLMRELWMVLQPRALEHAIPKLAERLYGFVTQQDCYRILDALFDFAEDLKNAKPPRWITHREWLAALAEDDMTLIVNGQARNA